MRTIETVVEEKPLSFATSRIVTILFFTISLGVSLNFVPSLADTTVDFKPLSSNRLRRSADIYFAQLNMKPVLLIVVVGLIAVTAAPLAGEQALQKQHSGTASPPNADPGQLFKQGEIALKKNDLDQAERSFRGVLALDPQAAGAYANLGVIYMRRKQWQHALEMLHQAEHLAPGVAGVRLNIGLVYYRQNDFRSAIPSFESVVRDAPDSFQARYLLGLCYFFTERYAEAASTLEPLWPQASSQFNYLYVLDIAAGKAQRGDLELRAQSRLVEIGQGSPELHLVIGKAHINREEYDDAIAELNQAAKAAPKLPFVHFYLGWAYLNKQDLDHAKAEFLRDIALEPDVAYDYDQLGVVDYLQQHDEDAEKNLRHALKLDPHLTSSHFQLARVYQREGKYAEALIQIDAAGESDPISCNVHYIRGQLLQRLGRSEEAKAEMELTTRMMNEQRGKRQKELYGSPLPNPELTQEPQ